MNIMNSDFVNHEIPIKSKTGKGINIASKIVEKLAKDVPFVSSVIGLIRTGMKITYDIFVLQTFANNVINFESLFGCDGSKFARLFALNITEKSVDKIKDIKQNCKNIRDANKRYNKINNEIEKIAIRYGDDLTKIIFTGYGEGIYKICTNKDNSYLDILAHLTIHHPKQSSVMKKSVMQNAIDKENLQKLLKNVASDEAKTFITSYFNEFGTPQFIDNIINIAKEAKETLDKII
eukprot:49365_1